MGQPAVSDGPISLHVPGVPLPDEWVDAGHGIRFAYLYTARGTVAGVLERHHCVDVHGRVRAGIGSLPLIGVPDWPKGWPRWSARSLHPLSLTPSIRCRTCGRHGWLTDGLWVPEPDDGLPPGRR